RCEEPACAPLPSILQHSERGQDCFAGRRQRSALLANDEDRSREALPLDRGTWPATSSGCTILRSTAKARFIRQKSLTAAACRSSSAPIEINQCAAVGSKGGIGAT